MTTTTAQKRLDEIETYLTPTDWAIRLADEMRKYPDPLAYMKAMVKLPLHELPMQRPLFALEKQAAARHPGKKPDDIRARHRLTSALWHEFHTLKLLFRQVDRTLQRKVETICLHAALRLTALHTLILEDALTRPAKPSAAFTEDESKLISLAEWCRDFTALLKDFYAHRAAVELVQARHFDGHPILFPELESELAEATRTIENAVATVNAYMIHWARFDGAEADASAGECPLAIAFESIKANVASQRAAALATKWAEDARHEASESDEELWERCREEFRDYQNTTGNG